MSDISIYSSEWGNKEIVFKYNNLKHTHTLVAEHIIEGDFKQDV